MKIRFDKLGVIIAFMAAVAIVWAPLAVLKPNRILQGEAKSILEALPALAGWGLLLILILSTVVAVLRVSPWLKLLVATVSLGGLALALGTAATFLSPADNTYARVSPASGFWILIFAFTIVAADAITRLEPPPWMRVLFLAITGAGIGGLLASGGWDGLSIMKEYASRADVFWVEAGRHVALALGSLAAAAVIGLPLGVLCHRVEWLRASVLNTLNLVQTIPSIALFGILIGPLAWVAVHVPGAAELGIRGIGMAPAFVALFVYSLLPVVANTVVGLGGVPRESNEAARGIGMTDRQRLFQVEFPLALPVILTAIRIVLVQNIGMATIAALIGGGGFGVFVFQGIGQTAMDLVLLGAVPTVALAFAAAVVLDALIETYSLVPKGVSAA